MAADGIDIDAVLDGWRASGADRVDPLRFHRIAALQRRAATRDGTARRALDARLAALVDSYAADLARASSVDRATSAAPSAPRALGTLVDDIARGRSCAVPGDRNAAQTGASTAAYPELAALDDFRRLWSTLRTGSQVRKSLADVPTGAGPLNSAALAHRALTLMGGLSPDYLRTFLAYVDTLSWLEQMQDAGVLTGKDAPQTASGKPRAKAKPRKRARSG